jgi:hypothetical protein
MPNELERFLDHARGKGLDLATIGALLRSAGWKDKQIAAAFCARELDLPVPEPVGAGSARDTFVHLLAFTALYTWVISLILLAFAYVDIAFPDPTREHALTVDWRLSGIRASLAALIVSYPLFLVLWRGLLREVRANPDRARGAVRRWLTWLSLFVGSVTLVSDVITLVYFLFEGELSTRFLLKVLALFVVTFAVLLYLWLTMRSSPEPAR